MKLVVGTTTDVYLKLFIILDRSCLLTSWDCVLRLLVLDAACEQLINHCPILLEHPSLEARLLFWLLFFLEVDFFSLFFVPECEVRFLRCIAASNLRFDDRWGLWRFLWNPIFTLPVGRKKVNFSKQGLYMSERQSKFKDFPRTFKAMYQQIQALNTEEALQISKMSRWIVQNATLMSFKQLCQIWTCKISSTK
jgi:hypothetical protein